MPTQRITVTLPPDLVEQIDREDRNRSRFVLEALKTELERRRREALRRSLFSPHEDTQEVSELGSGEWGPDSSGNDSDGLVDASSGAEVRWQPGEGWTEEAP